MMIISSAKVENFEPFGKAFCSQHPFAASPCETQDGSCSKQGAESTNETVSLNFFVFVLSFILSCLTTSHARRTLIVFFTSRE